MVTPANAYYRLTYEQASAIINTSNTNIRAESASNYSSKWAYGSTKTATNYKHLNGSTTVTALTLSTIDADPVNYEGKDYYRKYKNYVTISGTSSLSISQPYISCNFILDLEAIAEDWTLYVIAPYFRTVYTDREESHIAKIGYTSWSDSATSGKYDVTFNEITNYNVVYKYQQYQGANGAYGYRMGLYEIHLPAGNIGSVHILFPTDKASYNFTLAVAGVDGSNLVMTQIIEQLTEIAHNQQTIITYQQTISNNITRITTMSETEASEVAALKAKYSAITSNMESLMQAADDAMDDIHEILPDIEDLDPGIFDLQDYAPDWDNQEYLAPLQNAFQWTLITTMLVLSLVVAGISYILFGKKA